MFKSLLAPNLQHRSKLGHISVDDTDSLLSCCHTVLFFISMFFRRNTDRAKYNTEVEKKLTISEVQRANRQALAVTVFRLRAALSSAADTDGNIACFIRIR